MQNSKTKPISPDLHGLADYAFALASATVPTVLGTERKTIKLYQMIALQVFLYGAFSEHRFAIKRLIPLDIHRKIDLVNLAGIALLSANKKISKDKNTLAFNLALLGVGLVNVWLTDWTGSKRRAKLKSKN